MSPIRGSRSSDRLSTAQARFSAGKAPTARAAATPPVSGSWRPASSSAVPPWWPTCASSTGSRKSAWPPPASLEATRKSAWPPPASSEACPAAIRSSALPSSASLNTLVATGARPQASWRGAGSRPASAAPPRKESALSAALDRAGPPESPLPLWAELWSGAVGWAGGSGNPRPAGGCTLPAGLPRPGGGPVGLSGPPAAHGPPGAGSSECAGKLPGLEGSSSELLSFGEAGRRPSSPMCPSLELGRGYGSVLPGRNKGSSGLPRLLVLVGRAGVPRPEVLGRSSSHPARAEVPGLVGTSA
mmetsp:Transcript_57695/g.133215  ORF Transcript_57695/g.133215 Transcript_57695/m.133215 type:complete len:301 (+) Transcript_57695:862-1764(+)